MRISDWSSDVCSSDLAEPELRDLIEEFRQEEVQHRDTALEQGAAEAPAYPLLSRGIRAITRTAIWLRSEEHTSELQSLMRISYAVFCLKKKTSTNKQHNERINIHRTENYKQHRIS